MQKTGEGDRFAGMGFSKAPYDRAGDRRGDEKWIAGQRASADSRCILFVDGRPLIDVAASPAQIFFNTLETLESEAEPVLINIDDRKRAVFAIETHKVTVDRPETVKAIDLRSLAVQAILPPEQLGMLAQARSLLNWHQRHGYCANCGAKTVMADAGYRRHCSACSADHFPRVDPVVIMMVRHGDDFLLGRSPNFEENHYSALAGFVEPGETLESAVRRETLEETGVHVGAVCYVTSQPWPFPSSLMIGMSGQAVSRNIRIDRSELEDARWFSSAEIALMLKGEHQDGACLPPAMSIAWQMARELICR